MVLCVYLTTQAFEVVKDSDYAEAPTWYNEDIEGTFTFGDFTEFEFRYWAWWGWSDTCWDVERFKSLQGCYTTDTPSQPISDYAACWNTNPPTKIYDYTNLGTCYTWTWVANPAPNCTSTCWYGWGTVSGSVTCSTGNASDCNPNATKPSANTRSCSSTSACAAVVNGSCSTTRNACTRGTPTNVWDSASQYTWQCAGSGWGSTVNCSEDKAVGCKEAQWSPIMWNAWARPAVDCIHAVATNCNGVNYAWTYWAGNTTTWCPGGDTQTITCRVRDCTSTTQNSWDSLERELEDLKPWEQIR